MKLSRLTFTVMVIFGLVLLAGMAQAQMHGPYGPHYMDRGTMGPAYGMNWPGGGSSGSGQPMGMMGQGRMSGPYGPHYMDRGTFGPGYGMNWPGAYQGEYDRQTRKKLDEMWKVHYDEVSPIRQKIRMKKQQINEELYKENPDKRKLDSLREDLNKLYSDLATKETEFKRETFEKTGVKYDDTMNIWPEHGDWGMYAPDMGAAQ